MTQIETYYRILQVSYGADKAEISASYRRLCKLYHPDINPSPEAEERMKMINSAYAALCGDKVDIKAPAQPGGGSDVLHRAEILRAAAATDAYFSALQKGDYQSAFRLLSDYDKRYVTYQSFCEWRESVQKVFSLREFSVSPAGGIFAQKLKDGADVPAVRLMISIFEKNAVLHTIENYRITKNAVLEPGGWHVFLGYRDLSEISKVFDDFSAEQERGEMVKFWEEYCSNTCRDLSMLNRSGFLQKAEAEIYRYRRYRQQMVVALFKVRPVSSLAVEEAMCDIVDSAAKLINTSLRETDIAAYLGDGVFAVLFVEMRKKHSELITQRVANKLRSSIHKSLRMSILVDFRHFVYEGGSLEEYLDRGFI